jgi:hypothetical protein
MVCYLFCCQNAARPYYLSYNHYDVDICPDAYTFPCLGGGGWMWSGLCAAMKSYG